MERPWIGIPTRYQEKSEYIGQIRHYLDAILWAGGLPLLIPTSDDRGIIREYVNHVHGVLLPGSPTDVDPKYYGAAAHPKLGKLYPERDTTDFTILESVEEKNLPLLGICFGVQSLNVYRGGSLIQDVPTSIPKAVAHEADDGKPPARHIVRIADGSLIAQLADQREIEVNSYHHQAVDNPGRNLKPVAFAPDGVIEAVEDTTGRFILGVQWHPERGWKDDAFAKRLFTTFIDRVRLRYNQRQ
jgi:putative glutamine amidotransferase